MTSKYSSLRPGVVLFAAMALPALLLAKPATQDHKIKDQREKRQERLFRRADEELHRRAFPLNSIPAGAREKALAQTKAADGSGPRLPGVYTWQAIGPAPIAMPLDSASPRSGRVPCVAVDPVNNFHWLLGSAQGGIWETYNAGGTWAPKTDDQASLAIGAIAWAPSAPQVIYAGTGEPNFSGDCYAGAGLLVSYNNGTNWQMASTAFAETSISRIQVDPSQHNNLALTTVRGIAGKTGHGAASPPNAPSRGVFVSYNGGGIWSHALTGEATDLAMDPYNFNRQYAGLGEIFGAPTNGVYRTTNHWINSEPVNGPWTSITAPTNMGRIALAVAPSSSQTIYVAISYQADLGGLVGIWRGDNAWSASPTWTQLPYPNLHGIPWYSFALSVDPNDASVLYFAEASVQRYNGTWTDIAQFIHSDQHAMTWVPWGGFPTPTPRMLLGNDGGLWFSTIPVSSSWSAMNSGGLEISQVWKGSVHPQPNHALALAGTQDNGNAVNQGNLVWNFFQDGDGADSAMSSADPDFTWAFSWETYGGLHLYRTTDAANTPPQLIIDGMDDAYAPFFVHFEKSPRNDNVFIAGTVQMWLCANFFSASIPTWHSNGPVMLNNAGNPVAISALAFAPSDVNGRTYAYGTEDGQLRITTNAGIKWLDLDPTNGVPNRFVSGLAFSPTDPNTLYVTVCGFDEGTPSQPGHVFKTTNALSNSPVWLNVSPPVDLPMNCIAIDPSNPAQIYVGADIGVWMSGNAGGTWTHTGPLLGMPNVAVFDIKMNSLGGQVTAFTHGRGAFVWTLTIPSIEIAGPVRPYDIACLSCPPENYLNPGDLVTVEFPLQNYLPTDTVDLTATMLPSAEVIPVSGQQHYGVVHGLGPAVSRSFSFRAGAGPGAGPGSGACGSIVPVVLQLNDQGNDLGQVTLPFRLGVPSHPLSEEFESAHVPSLPPGWTTATAGAAAPWMSTSNSPPNANGGGDPDEVPDLGSNAQSPPNVSVFVPVLNSSGQSFLYSPPFSVASSIAQLYFRQAFDVSNAWDGCILEISIAGGPFQEITQAGGSFAQYGYNLTLNDHNPLGLRSAWSGDSGGWMPALVNLPPSAAGQTSQLRWHFASSSGDTNGVWFIDAAAITDVQCLPPVANPVILDPHLLRGQFTFSLATVSNRNYLIEFKTNLNQPDWQLLQTLSGNGATQTVSTATSLGNPRFFRFQVQ